MNRDIKFRAWHTDEYPIEKYRETFIDWENMNFDGCLDGVKNGNMVLEQHTGLKNIYEGDILKENRTVFFSEEHLGFFTKDLDGEIEPLYDCCSLEVIGNIHKELL